MKSRKPSNGQFQNTVRTILYSNFNNYKQNRHNYMIIRLFIINASQFLRYKQVVYLTFCFKKHRIKTSYNNNIGHLIEESTPVFQVRQETQKTYLIFYTLRKHEKCFFPFNWDNTNVDTINVYTIIFDFMSYILKINIIPVRRSSVFKINKVFQRSSQILCQKA